METDILTIRIATEDDLETLATFNEAMARETEDKTLDPATVRAGVHALLNDPSRGFYLVAEHESDVVGALMVTTEWSDWRNATFWWLQSVYVKPSARQQGVYSALYDHVKQQARTEGGVCGLRLYVERSNVAARQAYLALGMTETSYCMYEEMLTE